MKWMLTVMLALVTIVGLSSCMDPTLADNTFSWNVEADGPWTLRIDAEYSDGWKTHLIGGDGNEAFDLRGIIGVEQLQWSASFTRDVRASIVYDGEVVHDGRLSAGEHISWP